MEMQALSLVASSTSSQTRLPARDSASPPLLISSSANLFTYSCRTRVAVGRSLNCQAHGN